MTGGFIGVSALLLVGLILLAAALHLWKRDKDNDQSAAMVLFTVSCMALFIGTVASTSVRTPWEKEQEREVKLISITYSNGEVQNFRGDFDE